MKIRAANIVLIMIAFLTMSTACTVKEVPLVVDIPMEPVNSIAEEEPVLTPEGEPALAQEDHPSPSTEGEAELIAEEDLSMIKEESAATDTQVVETPTTKDSYDEYFSNSLFVGDSVMEGFAQYVRGQRKDGVSMLSDAQFLTSIMGIKVADIVGDTEGDSRRYYTYKGKEEPLETILNEMGTERVFIMLGMNDLGVGFSADETIERYRRMIPYIKEGNPGLDVVVLTTTPKTATKWLPDYIGNRDLDSPLLNEFAEMLRIMCEEEGIKMVDVNAAVRGEDGHLPKEYSRDDFVHINNECSAVILDTLRQFAKIQLGG